MTDKELITALKRMMVETGSLICMGCGHEHNCGIHGCAIIREAAVKLERMQWIPVGEKTPGEGQKVAVAIETNYGEYILSATAFFAQSRFHKDVAYWMPMPEPPKSDKKLHCVIRKSDGKMFLLVKPEEKEAEP